MEAEAPQSRALSMGPHPCGSCGVRWNASAATLRGEGREGEEQAHALPRCNKWVKVRRADS